MGSPHPESDFERNEVFPENVMSVLSSPLISTFSGFSCGSSSPSALPFRISGSDWKVPALRCCCCEYWKLGQDGAHCFEDKMGYIGMSGRSWRGQAAS